MLHLELLLLLLLLLPFITTSIKVFNLLASISFVRLLHHSCGEWRVVVVVVIISLLVILRRHLWRSILLIRSSLWGVVRHRNIVLMHYSRRLFGLNRSKLCLLLLLAATWRRTLIRDHGYLIVVDSWCVVSAWCWWRSDVIFQLVKISIWTCCWVISLLSNWVLSVILKFSLWEILWRSIPLNVRLINCFIANSLLYRRLWGSSFWKVASMLLLLLLLRLLLH